MIDEKLNGLIKEAMLDHKEVALRTLRLIKTKFMEFKTNEKNVKNNIPLDEQAEKDIIKGMISAWKKEIAVCNNAGRPDRAASLQEEVDFMQTMIPQVSAEDIKKAVDEIVNDPSEKMGTYIGQIKAKFPDAEGSVIAGLVKQRMSELQ